MEFKDRQQEAFSRLFSNISIPDIASADDVTLSETRRNLWLVMDNLVQASDIEKRELTPDEDLAYSYAEGRIVRIDHERRKREDSKPQRVPGGLGKIVSSDDGDIEYEEKSHVGKVGLSYRDLFHKGATGELDNGGFRSHEEFYRVLASGKYDPRIAKRTHVSGIGSLGGVSVSDNLANIIWSVPLEKGVVMPRAKIFPIAAGNSITVPYFDGFDHQTDGLFGGFTGQWLGEAVTAAEQNARLQDIELTAYKLAIFTGASNELLTDSLTFESSIGDAMKQAVNFKLDEAFLTGDGVAKPIGALVSPSAIALNRTTTGTIAYSDITAMYGRMHPACYANAVWIVSPSVVPALCAMVDAGNHTLWVMSASEGVPGTIFGLPVIVSEKLAALGSAHDIALVDFSQYGVVMRKEIVLEKTNAMHFTSDVSDFRCIVRVNGRSLWASAVTPAAGGATLSWCVSLNA